MHRTKIFGPPGTGKTTRLLNIMEGELAAGLPPERLAYLTFTVAARAEAKTRAATKFGFHAAQLKWFRTLHSVAYELLGVEQAALVTKDQGLEEFEREYGYEFSRDAGRYTGEGLPMFGFNPADKLMAFDHFRRHRQLTWQDAYKQWPDHDFKYHEVERFCDGYERWKRLEGWVDFTDLLERGATPLPCDVVIVDESQDLSPLQWRALWEFARNAERVYVAGDDDQAIYEWAGASPEVLLQQPADVTEVLPQSFRCPRKVTDLAQHLIERVAVRQAKEWRARNEEGLVRYCAHVDQAEVPETGTVRVLYRNHKFAAAAITHLKSAGEPYLVAGVPSVNPTAATAILTWEALRQGRSATRDGLEAVFSLASFQRISQTARDCVRRLEGNDGVLARDLVASGCWTEQMFTVPWFTLFNRLKEDEYYLRQVVKKHGRAGLTARPRILLNTIHSVKGAEADHVLLLTDMSKMVRQGLESNPDAERRVWYVGVTRARQSLTVIGMDNPLF